MATADVNLLEMADAPVARCDGDVFELDVHVILGYIDQRVATVSISLRKKGKKRLEVGLRTFNQLAAVCCAAVELQSHNVALSLIKELDGNTDR